MGGGEYASLGSGRGVDGFFRRFELDLVLTVRLRTVRVCYAGGDLQAALGQALGAEDDGDSGGRERLCQLRTSRVRGRRGPVVVGVVPDQY